METIEIKAGTERALIVPEAGCQCFSYKVGAPELIAGPVSEDAWRAHPHRGGIPILFPWPGRIANAQFTFDGRKYHVPVNEPAHGNAIHGFACEKAFRVLRRGPDFVSSILDSAEHPSLKRSGRGRSRSRSTTKSAAASGCVRESGTPARARCHSASARIHIFTRRSQQPEVVAR